MHVRGQKAERQCAYPVQSTQHACRKEESFGRKVEQAGFAVVKEYSLQHNEERSM